MHATSHLLIVDDDWGIRDGLQRFFAEHGLTADLAQDAEAARRALRANRPDLVLLDVMMPGEDGFSLCRYLQQSQVPVILLTARTEDEARLEGFSTGADDYVCKPFNPLELLARVRAVLRRTRSDVPSADQGQEVTEFRFDRWTLQSSRRHLIREDGVVVPLSASEFQLLIALVRHPKQLLSRDRILDLIGADSGAVFDRSVDSQISRLRRKLEVDPKSPRLITTVWGGGYLFDSDVQKT